MLIKRGWARSEPGSVLKSDLAFVDMQNVMGVSAICGTSTEATYTPQGRTFGLNLNIKSRLDTTAPKTMPKIVLTHGLEMSGQVPEEQPMKR